MNSEQHEKQTLVAEKDALSVYFEALLREPEPEVAIEENTPEASPAVETETETPPASTTAAVPEWGEETFQALLFKVGGLTLAVPLVELSGVQELSREAVTPMPGHAPWYLGLMDYRDRSVPVVDTAHLVLPTERLAALKGDPAERLTRVVFIDDGRWGLGCDTVADVITLTPDKVRWRTSRTRRQWLAGTVIDHMCAIIDPPAFGQMLATGLEDAQDDDDTGTDSA